MLTSSKKAKGRGLQKLVRDMILKDYPELTEKDVVSRGMGQAGSDLILSDKAEDYVPFTIECKNQEGFKKLYDAYKQGLKNHPYLDVLVVIKSNNEFPIAALPLGVFLKVLKKANENNRTS